MRPKRKEEEDFFVQTFMKYFRSEINENACRFRGYGQT